MNKLIKSSICVKFTGKICRKYKILVEDLFQIKNEKFTWKWLPCEKQNCPMIFFFEILTGTFQENWGQTILRFWPQNILIYSEKILNLKNLRQYDKRFLSSDLFCFLFFLFHSWLIEVQEPLFHTFRVFLSILFPRILFA